jgi:hypothetical protein
MSFLGVNTKSLKAVAEWKAKESAMYIGPAMWRLFITICCDVYGVPLPDPTGLRRIWFYIKTMAPPAKLQNDIPFQEMQRAVDQLNLLPDIAFNSFFDGCEGYLHDFRGGLKRHKDRKRGMMRSVRHNILGLLMPGKGDAEHTVEGEDGMYMNFAFHGINFQSVVDNTPLERSSMVWCKSTIGCFKNAQSVPVSISFVHCPP